ncbi:CARDB domain-containing protein [Chloroflexota bacterium]
MMMKGLLAIAIVLLLVFIAGCSWIPDLTEDIRHISFVANPEITTKVNSVSKWQVKQAKIDVGGEAARAVRVITDSNERVTKSDETNNVKTFYLSALAPDLIIEAITWSPANPSKGDIVTFSVKIKNQGGGSAIRSRVNFYVDGRSKYYKDTQKLDANEVVTETFTWTAEAGSHSIKAVADAEKWVAEGNESNNEKTATIQIFPPDLVIQSITWSPANPLQGDNITFTVTIRNEGSAKADYSSVAFHIDDARLDFATTGPINPGGTISETFSWIAQGGSHIAKAVADPYNKVVESDDNNNEKTVTFPPLVPDLIIQSITWPSTSSIVGETLTFTVVIKNQGNAIAGSSSAHFYIDESSEDYQDVQRIGVNDSVTMTFTWVAKAGSYAVKVIADLHNRVTESDESNNEGMITFAGASPPDLIIQDITWPQEILSIGEEVTFTVNIKNQGNGEADYFHVTYFIDNVYLSSTQVSPISPGATTNQTFTWIVEAGSHIIQAVADSDTTIPESNEKNNEKSIIYPVPPDLTIKAITWSSANLSESDNVTFTVTVENQGSGKADNSSVAYYIDDDYLALVPIGPIDPGATANNSFTWVAQAGSPIIKVVADQFNKVLESNENNNEKTTTLLVSVYLPPAPTPEPTPTPGTEAKKPPAGTVEPIHTPETEGELGLWWIFIAGVLLGSLFIAILLDYRRQRT